MFKLIKIGFLLTLMVIGFEAGKVWQDKATLHNTLVRMHVVANSDSAYDQEVKLKVKDAIVSYIAPYMENINTREEALEFLGTHLEEIRCVGLEVLDALGVSDDISIMLGEENFDTREYDTFSLPAGNYQTLRVNIGDADGKNWWCVAFPTLCVPTSTAEFEDVAVSVGLNEEITNTLTREDGYVLRFYLWDQMGKLENFFSCR